MREKYSHSALVRPTLRHILSENGNLLCKSPYAVKSLEKIRTRKKLRTWTLSTQWSGFIAMRAEPTPNANTFHVLDTRTLLIPEYVYIYVYIYLYIYIQLIPDYLCIYIYIYIYINLIPESVCIYIYIYIYI